MDRTNHMRTHHFQAQGFFRKAINIIFMYLLTPFIKQNFKKILRADPKLSGCTIFRPKIAYLPQKIIFKENPLVHFVTFIHVYLYAKNQSQMSIH